MKKLGIITIYDIDNYGNRLQNYAVKKTLENHGYSVDSIAFLDKIQIKVFLRILLEKILPKNKKRHVQRNRLFLKFTINYLNQKYYVRKKDRKRYEAYVCGSDQVWNPNRKSQPYMFANFAPLEKRVAFAASFGVGNLPNNKEETYAKYLSEMKCISVREEAGAKIVQKLTERSVPVLIDPTLMLNKNDWMKLSSKPKFKMEKKYLLTYFLGEVSNERNIYIENVARENGLHIIRLESKNPLKEWYETGPAEFIWLIEQSSLVCTDSFHGTIFAVLMDVPFVVFTREDNLEDMNSRMDTLLSILQLEDRKAKCIRKEKVLKTDYTHISPILLEERKKVMEYLDMALETEK